jgi:hypothetical protein
LDFLYILHYLKAIFILCLLLESFGFLAHLQPGAPLRAGELFEGNPVAFCNFVLNQPQWQASIAILKEQCYVVVTLFFLSETRWSALLLVAFNILIFLYCFCFKDVYTARPFYRMAY